MRSKLKYPLQCFKLNTISTKHIWDYNLHFSLCIVHSAGNFSLQTAHCSTLHAHIYRHQLQLVRLLACNSWKYHLLFILVTRDTILGTPKCCHQLQPRSGQLAILENIMGPTSCFAHRKYYFWSPEVPFLVTRSTIFGTLKLAKISPPTSACPTPKVLPFRNFWRYAGTYFSLHCTHWELW